MTTTPDMALVYAASLDPKWYTHITQNKGDQFLTDTNAVEAWKLFDTETGTFDEVSLFRCAAAWNAYQLAMSQIETVTMQHIDRWVKHCRANWQSKLLQEAVTGMEALPPDEQIGNIHAALERIHDIARPDDSEGEIQRALDDIERISQGLPAQNVFGWPIGWLREFEDVHRHEFIVVGGRPGTGKSALMGQVAYEYAKQGQNVLFISLEMTPPEIYHRWTAYECGFGLKRISLNTAKAERYKATFKRIASMDNMTVTCKTSLAEILAEISAAKLNGVDIVFIDYLQLIQGAPNRSRLEEISATTRTLKRVAMSGIPVVTGSQLNRESDKDDGKPKLSQLRESGTIEQDADRVLLLHLDKQGDSWLIQAKLRNGERKTIKTVFTGETYSFNSNSRWGNE